MKATVAILMLACVNAVGVAQAPRTTWSGVYTEAQAKRGAIPGGDLTTQTYPATDMHTPQPEMETT